MLFIVFFLQCCLDDNSLSDDRDNENEANFSQLNGNSYVLVIDRVSELPDVQFPHEDLHEDDYVESAQDIQYEVSFSDDIQTVTIKSKVLISGEIEKDDEDQKKYSLTNELLAGGRLNIWIEDRHFEAELTVYGSGIPILKSERGILEPKT